MSGKNEGTLQKVTGTVTQAVKTLADATERYVVAPVGKALGLTTSEQKRPSPARRKELKSAAKQRTLGKARAAR